MRNVDFIYKLQKPVSRNGSLNSVESRNATSTSANPFKRNFEAANMSSETDIEKIIRLSANKSNIQLRAIFYAAVMQTMPIQC